MLALFVLLAGVLDRLRQWAQGRVKSSGWLAVLPVAAVVLWPWHLMGPTPGLDRVHIMGRYLREALPANAVVLTFIHGGAIALHTGRPIVRLDLIGADQLHNIVSDLQRRRLRPVIVMDVLFDYSWLRNRLHEAPLAPVNWPARAEFASVSSINYYDVADRAAFGSGERWPTDVLISPPTTRGSPWSDFRAPNERVILPALEEEYLRARVANCSHDDATASVISAIVGKEEDGACGEPR
jgi:hypothetical protein